MMRWLWLWSIGLFLFAVAAMVFAVWRSDLPLAYLEKKYAPLPSRFLNLGDGARVHYRDVGREGAPALILLHGSSSSLHTWEPWMELLRSDYRVLALDLPGHGLTGPVPGHDASMRGMADLVHQFARARGIERAVLVGNSMGARVALTYAQLYPQAVRALILVSGGAQLDEDERSVGLFRFVRHPLGRAVLTRILPRGGVARTLRASVAEPQEFVTEAMIDRYYELLLRPGNRVASARRFAAAPEEIDVRAIAAPALLLWGEEDQLVPPKYGVRLHALLPRSELILYPDVGHLAMEEIAQKSARDARDFLTRALAPPR